MMFDPEKYLANLSMNGGSSELTKEQNAQVFAELYRRMGKEPEKEAESQDGTA
jgi:hypothetical protein